MKKILTILFLLLFTFINAVTINVPADQPSIQAGIDAAANGDTVLVQPGTYVENINYNGKLITVASLYLTTVDSSYISSTIIDGNSSGRVVAFNNGEGSTAVLCGFTITNGLGYEEEGGGIYCSQSSPTLENLIISGNFCFSLEWNNSYGGGIYCFQSSPSLENVVISENQASGSTYSGKGGGIFCNDHSNPILQNVTITGNSVYGSNGQGGGIYCFSSSNPSLINVTITGNSATYYGGGIFCEHDSNPILVNCIMWNDSPEEIYFSSYFDPNTIVISYSDIEGGETGIVTNNNGIVNWLEGNIDSDPLFVDTTNGDNHLQSISPCIDAGDPNFPFDPDNTIIDMGAFYYHQDQYIVVEEIYPEPGSLTISEGDSINFYILANDPDGNPIEYSWELDGEIVSTDSSYIFYADENSAGSYAITLEVTDNYQPPSRNTLNFEWDIIVEDVSSAQELLPTVTAIYQNFPNPFNPTTTISFSVTQKSSFVTLGIYNIKGQKVKDLSPSLCHTEPVEVRGEKQYSVVWNGTDDNDKPVSSGIYFYKLKSENFEKTRKMILLK